MQTTVHVRLGHGFGNRLFQYASIKGIAAKLGYRFNVLENSVDSEHDHKTYDWFIERIQYDVGVNSKYYGLGKNVIYNQLDSEHIGVGTNIEYIRDASFDNLLMNGYFQSEANFTNIKDELRGLLCEESADVKNALDTNFPHANTCIALHIRLGDYMVKTGHLINLQKYYETCITTIRKENTAVHFLIVCEDPQNISQVYPNLLMFIEEHNTYSFDYPPLKIDPVEYDMYLLARCAGVICSNSTFSWWGAWIGLNRNDYTRVNNRVFIPDKWHHHNQHYVGMDGAIIVSCV